jgi:hypothetical protein
MIRQGLLLVTVIAMATFAAPLSAQGDRSRGDRLIIENVDPSAGVSGVRPNRGMSMETVESRWGTPLTKRNAVGDPPITRWEYPTFVVYFEYRNVIHAVNIAR